MRAGESFHWLARWIIAFSAHHAADATSIEVNTLEGHGRIQLRRVAVLNPRALPETAELASMLVAAGVLPAGNVECRAPRADVVTARWCSGFLKSSVPSRLERGAGTPVV
jgi:hypothetical protein